jgi:hypothetical protein
MEQAQDWRFFTLVWFFYFHGGIWDAPFALNLTLRYPPRRAREMRCAASRSNT